MGLEKPEYSHFEPVRPREYAIMGTLGVAAIVFGVVPVLVFNVTGPTFSQLMNLIGARG